jgi:hypothetical protein
MTVKKKNMSNYQGRKKQNQQTNVLAVVVGGFFKLLWWLITLPFKKRQRATGLSAEVRGQILNKKSEIVAMLNSENIYELKHAVIEADKLVDYILKAKGYAGETFADRLRSAEKYINNQTYQSIWQGHKIRNQIAHENDKIDKNSLIQATKMLLEYTNE